MAFSPDGQTLAVGSHGGSISLWNVSTGQTRVTLSGHKKWISELLFSPEGQVLTSASGDKTAKVWNTETGNLLASFNEHKSPFMKLSLSAVGRLLSTASDEDKAPVPGTTSWDVPGVAGSAILPPTVMFPIGLYIARPKLCVLSAFAKNSPVFGPGDEACLSQSKFAEANPVVVS